MLDFLGRLTDDEIEVAKEFGLLRWDLFVKATQIAKVNTTMEQRRAGWNVAPVMDGSGQPDAARYPADKKFLISNYSELEAKQAKNTKT